MVQTTQPIPGTIVTQIITDGADCYPWMETFVIFPKKTITGKRLCWEKHISVKFGWFGGQGFTWNLKFSMQHFLRY
jgi:hypothetical protein